MATATGSLSESQNSSASTTNYHNAKMPKSGSNDVPAGDIVDIRKKRFSRMVSDGRLGLGIDVSTFIYIIWLVFVYLILSYKCKHANVKLKA